MGCRLSESSIVIENNLWANFLYLMLWDILNRVSFRGNLHWSINFLNSWSPLPLSKGLLNIRTHLQCILNHRSINADILFTLIDSSSLFSNIVYIWCECRRNTAMTYLLLHYGRRPLILNLDFLNTWLSIDWRLSSLHIIDW